MSAEEFRGRLCRLYVYIARFLAGRPEWAQQLKELEHVAKCYAPAETMEFRHGDSPSRDTYPDSDVRYFVVALLRVAQRIDNDGYTRIREYRNVLWIATACTTLLAAALLLASVFFPQAFPVPSFSGAASGFQDVGAIMLYGVLGGTVSVLTTLPSLPEYEAPYSLRNPQLVLKVSSGALTAFIGVILVHTTFLPWVKTLGRQPGADGAIAVAAIIFGYVQQFITRTIDQEAETIVSAARPYVEDRPSRGQPDAVRSF